MDLDYVTTRYNLRMWNLMQAVYRVFVMVLLAPLR